MFPYYMCLVHGLDSSGEGNRKWVLHLGFQLKYSLVSLVITKIYKLYKK